VTSDVVPGTYKDIPADDYFAWPFASASLLNQIHRSPAHARAWSEADDDDNKTKKRGTGGHAAILEPDTFAATYAEGPTVDLRTKAGKECWAEFTAANPGKEHVRGEEWPHLIGMRDAVWAHPVARRILSKASGRELSLVWDDRESGVRCKGRLDVPPAADMVIADLKCLRDARPRHFQRAIYDRGYHRQAAHYMRGAAALGLAADIFAFIVVENTPPYAVMVYQLDSTAIEEGDADLRTLLMTYDECTRTGRWPAYDDAIRTIGLPDWAGFTREETFA
jgi:hypothetical protein